MGFITKLDYSDNRQIRQRVETQTQLSGGTTFGVPYTELVRGVDESTTGVTSTTTGVTSTFSGNTGTTVFFFGDTRMELAGSDLEPITPSNSGDTQTAGVSYTGDSTTIVDNNQVYLTYTGIGYNLIVTNFEEVSAGNYTGATTSDLTFYSGDTADYTGSTVWLTSEDSARVKGILYANVLSATTIVGATISGITDNFITGATWSPDTLTLTNATGGTINTVINNFNDVTVNNSLSATTISGGTFYGDGSNLSGVSSEDIYVTGGTYSTSGSTLTLTRNDDVSIDITGITSGGDTAILRNEDTLSTTADTLTTISTFTGVTNNTSRFVEHYLTAHKDGVDYGFWKRTLAVNNVTGNANIEYVNADVDVQSSGLTTTDVLYSGIGSNILVQVSGEVAKTYNWVSTWEVVDEGVGGKATIISGLTSTFNPVTTEPTGTTINLTSSDSVIGVDTTTDVVTINLPDSVATGNITYFIKDIGFNAVTNNITINPSGSDNIYFTSIVSSIVINTNGGAYILSNNGSGSWYVM